MSTPRPDPTTGATRAAVDAEPENASTGELIGRLTEQISRLVRDEARLAQVEMTQKAKRLGVGAGLFGAAGLVAFFGLAALITTAILALALLMPAWLAALIVTLVLFAIAGVLALVGKKDVQKGSPPVPTEAISSVQTDIATVKESARR
ncbi:phage holin family protein [Blastococcus sp. SYSU DS1024]